MQVSLFHFPGVREDKIVRDASEEPSSRKRSVRCALVSAIALLLCAIQSGCQLMGGAGSLLSRDRDNSQATPSLAGEEQGWRQFEAAQTLYDQRKFADAEDAFSQLARMRERRNRSWGSQIARWFDSKSVDPRDVYENFGDPIEEDALYMLAESQFSQGDFSHAQDSYDELINRYPSTRHLNTVSQRMFSIAHYWLGFPEETLPSEIRLASLSEEAAPALNHRAPPPALLPNFTDHTRPLFDSTGRAEQALKSVWMNDPTGPLADDALMLTANFKSLQDDNDDAAYYYALVRDQYPDSPHFQDAFLMGSHVTLATYQGPSYDSRPLQEAQGLKETAQQIFPDLEEEQRRLLNEELVHIADAVVAREWEKVEYYLRKDQPASVALHCNYILHHHPNSRYADQARELLAQLEQEGVPLTPIGMGAPPRTAATTPPVEPEEPVEETQEPRRSWWPGFLRRAEEPPELAPPPEPAETLPPLQQAPAPELQSPGRTMLQQL